MAETTFDELRVAAGTVRPYSQSVFSNYIAGAQTASAKKFSWVAPFAGQVVSVRLRVDTAPTGATLIVDINKNGVTMYTTQGNRPTVAISGNDGTTTLPDIVTFAAGDRITFDVDQVGSGVAGSDLSIAIGVKALTTN